MSETEFLTRDGDPPSMRKALVERAAPLLGPALPLDTTGSAEDAEGDELNLRELWHVIVKRRWTIILFTLIVVTAVVTATFLKTPIYRASTTVQIDREDIKITKIEDVTPVESSGSGQD